MNGPVTQSRGVLGQASWLSGGLLLLGVVASHACTQNLNGELEATGGEGSVAAGGHRFEETSSGGATSPAGGGTGGSGVCGPGAEVAPPMGGSSTGQPPPLCAPSECEHPEPVLVNGEPVGFERCEGTQGPWLHRSRAVRCPRLIPRDVVLEPIKPPPVGERPEIPYDECTSDADCAGALEFCRPSHINLPGGCAYRRLECQAGCEVDSDCESGHICLCGDPIGLCVPAFCTSDADCTAGYHCSSAIERPDTEFCDQPEPYYAFACTTPEDTCRSSVGCTPPTPPGSSRPPMRWCLELEDGPRSCSP
jgi:hypothetical protein